MTARCWPIWWVAAGSQLAAIISSGDTLVQVPGRPDPLPSSHQHGQHRSNHLTGMAKLIAGRRDYPLPEIEQEECFRITYLWPPQFAFSDTEPSCDRKIERGNSIPAFKMGECNCHDKREHDYAWPACPGCDCANALLVRTILVFYRDVPHWQVGASAEIPERKVGMISTAKCDICEWRTQQGRPPEAAYRPRYEPRQLGDWIKSQTYGWEQL